MRRYAVPRRARLLWGVLVVALLLAACSSGGASGSSRPSTPASLRILSPAPNSTSPPDVDLRLDLRRARIVPANVVGGALRGDRGHIHVRVDGQIVTMAYGLEQTIPGLTPGRHTIQAEFVATDHVAFANHVIAAVTFTVAR